MESSPCSSSGGSWATSSSSASSSFTSPGSCPPSAAAAAAAAAADASASFRQSCAASLHMRGDGIKCSHLHGDGITLVPPQPLPESLQTTGPPPFLVKTYDMVDDPCSDSLVSWSSECNSFVVWDPFQFSLHLLPRYFKHSNFSSFVRQLNTYGFRKIHPGRMEFANESFLRGHRHLLKNIQRKKTVTAHGHPSDNAVLDDGPPCVQSSKFNMQYEIEQLKRDRNFLLMELVTLRRQQRSLQQHLRSMGLRLQSTERKQQQFVAFFMKALEQHRLLSQLMREPENAQMSSVMKRRRLSGNGTPRNGDEESGQAVMHRQLVKFEPESDHSCPTTQSQVSWTEVDTSRSNYFEAFLLNMIASFPAQPQELSSQQGRPTLAKPQNLQGASKLSMDLSGLIAGSYVYQELGSMDPSVSKEESSCNSSKCGATELRTNFPVIDVSYACNAGGLQSNGSRSQRDMLNDAFWEPALHGKTESIGSEPSSLPEHSSQSSVKWNVSYQIDELAQQMDLLGHGMNY